MQQKKFLDQNLQFMNKSIHYCIWILIYSAVAVLIPLLSFSVFPLLPCLFSFLSLPLSLSLGSMPSPAVCSAPTVRAQGRPGSQLARHCGASRQAHGGPPAPASSFANMPRCGAWWLGLWCVCVCWRGGHAGGSIKGGYSHWSCVNTECMGVFVAWGWGGGRSQWLLAHCNHIVGKLLIFCQAARLAHRQMLRAWCRAFI